MDATVVCIDQTKKSVQVKLRAAWFPRRTRPSVELSGQRDWTCLLGAITEDNDRFFSRFDECWRQLTTALNNRLFDSLEQLNTATNTAFD